MSISMIPKAKELKLISIYLYICDLYDSELKYLCQRFSNNNEPEFTDQEVITIYLYVMQVEQRLKIKQIHSFANDYLRSWFPRLHSYEAFVVRINRLSEVFIHISSTLLSTPPHRRYWLSCMVFKSILYAERNGRRYASTSGVALPLET